MTTSNSTESRAVDHDAQRRRRVVWTTLVAAMTGVGALLAGLQGERSPRLDGVALAAAIPADGPNAAINTIFNTRAPLESGRWDGIVIHDSGSSSGSAATIAAEHEARGLLGLGHHFVIGNGKGSDDGELYVGYRWLDQLPGAHAAGPEQDSYNRRYIGICLIGDGDRKPFTEAQMSRLVELVRSLTSELGIPPEHVILHRDIAATTSPGRFFSEATLRRALASGPASGL
ncbi:MAG: N-acetylmuramoyl-L-alanine amidase [Phycisphaeraceae bacterium]|nr:N-acetylmuramoyl-L-alanine amidase [Phycisphaeraceae bacterium]